MSAKNLPVTVVVPDASSNALGRALLLAELVADDAEVRIVGVQLSDSMWAPAKKSRIPIHTLRLRHAGGYPRAARFVARYVPGSRIVVSKPRATSLGLALMAGIGPGGMLLDVDDWEVGFRLGRSGGPVARLGRRLSDTRDLLAPRTLNSYPSEVLLDYAAQRFPHKIVSNAWLASRFGGAVLPHVRDTNVLDPAHVDAAAVRRELSMDGRLWVGFVGTVRPHKGVEVLVDALSSFQGADAPGLYLAGMDEQERFASSLVKHIRHRLGPERIRIKGVFDFAELTRWVAAADIICIPSLDAPAAWGQIPAKLFDAMAMAKPLIVTRVNDMESALQGSGRVVPAGDAAAIAAAIRELAADESLRRELGEKARQRAIERFSYDAGRRIMLDALSDVSPRKPTRP